MPVATTEQTATTAAEGTPPRLAINRGVAMTDAQLDRFLAAPRIASLAYARRDGRPFQVPVWFQWRDGEVLVGTGANDPKVAAIRRNPAVVLLVQDERAPYRVVLLEGSAEVEVLDRAHDLDPTAGIAVEYLGRIGGRIYEQQMAESGVFDTGRAIIHIRPTTIRSHDGVAALPRSARIFAAVRTRLPIPNRWL